MHQKFSNRAVSVHYLSTTFLDEVIATPGLTRESTVYDIENLDDKPGVIRRKGFNVICPRDGLKDAAYVDCITGDDNVSDQATHMLSYSWGYKIGDIVDTLVDFCNSTGQNPKRTYVWICCLCINQHRVVQQKRDQRSGIFGNKVDFFAEFGERVAAIGHVLVMMAPWSNPFYLQRVWCVYELYKAYSMQCKVTIVMPPSEKDALKEDLFGENGKGVDGLYDVLGKTRIQNANSSVSSDREAILEIVENCPGFAALNGAVNGHLRTWVRQTIDEIICQQEKSMHDKADQLSVAMFFNTVSDLLRRNGEHDDALRMARKGLAAIKDNCSKRRIEDKDEQCTMAESHNNIGLALSDMADFDSALLEYKHALDIQEAILGEKSIDTAKTYYNLGNSLFKKGEYDAALAKLRLALAIRVSILGEMDKDTALSYSSIGAVMHEKGAYDDALVHYKKALTIQNSVLGENHPDIAQTLCNIGGIYHDKYDFDEALSEFQRALLINESVLGKSHPDTAALYSIIGSTLYSKGDYDASLREHQKSLAIRESVLGKYHPLTGESLCGIGEVLHDMGELDDALSYYENALSVQESVLGKKHIVTTGPRNNMGLIHFARGQYDLALAEYRKSLAVTENVVGREHPDTARLFNRIGNVLRESGDFDGALVEYHNALAILEEDHFFADMVQENIAKTKQENSISEA